MRDGDLSNEVAPRAVFVVEHLLLHLVNPAAYQFFLSARRWKKAAQQWEPDGFALSQVWNIVMRTDLNVDLISFEPEPVVERFGDVLGRVNAPFAVEHEDDPGEYARRLAYMPHVQYVVHSVPEYSFTFGRRGQYVRDFGAFDGWLR